MVHQWGKPPPGQGSRTDLKALLSDVVDGETGVREFARANPDVFCRYSRGVQHLARIAQEAKVPLERSVNVEVHWGVSGSGKSYYAYHYSDAKDTYVLFHKTNKTVWFDGYEGETTLIIDEYEPGEIGMSMMLSILDRYRKSFPVKGGSVIGAWTTVLVTSNHHPSDWYPMAVNIDALMRRINVVVEYKFAFQGVRPVIGCIAPDIIE